MSLFREQAIQERANRLHGRVILATKSYYSAFTAAITITILFVFVWLSLSSYNRTEKVRGILVTEQPSAKVFASSLGTLTGLYVRDGSIVEKGARLAVVDVAQTDDTGNRAATKMLGSVDNRLKLSQQQIANTSSHDANERKRLEAATSNADAQIYILRSRERTQQSIIDSNNSMLVQIEPVMKKGFISKSQYEARRQNLLMSENDMAQIRQQIAILQKQRNDAQYDLYSLKTQSANSINAVDQSIELLHQQQSDIKERDSYLLKSPISGRVTNLQLSAGGRTDPTVPLLTIIPFSRKLEAEFYAPSKSVGFLKINQEVRLQFDSFPYEKYGTFSGRVKTISHSVLYPGELSSPFKLEEPVYKVRVTVSVSFIDAYGERLPLQPGMLLNGNVILERQSFLSWLLDPIRAITRRS